MRNNLGAQTGQKPRAFERAFVQPVRRCAATWISLAMMLAILSIPISPLRGQSGKAGVSGSVTDPSGAFIPDVDITAVNTLTGQSKTTTTASNGTYVLTLLTVGTYKVTFSKSGFRSTTQDGIVLTPDQVATVNARLTLGTSTQTVEVSANAGMLETSTAALGQVVSEKAMLELPLNGRNPGTLVFLTPGAMDVTATSVGKNQADVSNPNDTGASANGGRQGSTYYLLDGANNMDANSMLGNPFPNPDATQEFRVLGNNFSAEYGFAPGAVVSVVTKSGTNEWHGVGYEFLRNYATNAANFFSHVRDTLIRNQFGGSIGGPIKHDKLFIFGNYQRTQEGATTTVGTAYVPTNAELKGDFSGLLTGRTANLCGSGGPANLTFDTGQIFQPSVGTPVVCPVGSAMAGKTVAVKQPFPGNLVDPSLLDPVSLKIAESIPRATTANGFLNLVGAQNDDHTDEFLTRVDYNLSANNHISGRVFYQRYNLLAGVPGNFLITTRPWLTSFNSYSANWTSTLKPNLVNNFVWGWNRDIDHAYPGLTGADGKPVSLALYGANIPLPGGIYPPGIWSVNVTGYFRVSGNTNLQVRHSASYTDTLSWTKGRHLLVAGVDLLRQDLWNATDFLASPGTTFNGQTTGNALSDFLLGYSDDYKQSAGVDDKNWTNYYGFFVQDTIRLTPRFTINAGLRWEPYFPTSIREGRAAAFRPGEQSTRYPNAPPGLIYPGDPGFPGGPSDSGVPGDWKELAPRIGIAWQPRALPNTSIRAAAGIFIVPFQDSYYQHNSATAPFCTTYDINYITNGLIKIDNPWASYAPTGGVAPFPPWCLGTYSEGQNPPSNSKFIVPVTVGGGFGPDFHLGKYQSWNISVQHQFTVNTLLTVAYVGSETYHLPILMELNPGIFAAGGLRTTYPNFASIPTNFSWGTSSYNALQISFEKRFSHGLQVTSNYTWSKTLDDASAGDPQFYAAIDNPFNYKWNHGISDLNFPMQWVSSFVWVTPGLQGQKAALRTILGNWQTSGIAVFRSGNPFSIMGGCNGNNNSLTLIGADRADFTGQPLNVHAGSEANWLTNYFNPAAFQCNAPGTFGNTPRNLMAGPALSNWDLGIDKLFPFKERYRVEFRWEMFNAFNTPHFSNPATNPAAPGFGTITTLASPPRVMQFGMKINF